MEVKTSFEQSDSCYFNDQNLTFLRVYQETHWNRLSDHSLCRGKVMSFESDKARKRSIYIPCGLITLDFKLLQLLLLTLPGSSQFQTGRSPTLIFTCISLQATEIHHFQYWQYSPSFETGVRDGKAMRCKWIVFEAQQHPRSGWWKLQALNFFLCKCYRRFWSLKRCKLMAGSWRIVDRFILVVQFCIIS